MVLEIGSKTLHMLDKCPAVTLYAQPLNKHGCAYFVFFFSFSYVAAPQLVKRLHYKIGSTSKIRNPTKLHPVLERLLTVEPFSNTCK